MDTPDLPARWATAALLAPVATAGGTLQITATRDFLSQDRPQVHLVVIDLEAISLDGGARAGIDSLSRDALGVELSGGSVLTATGSVGMLAMDAGGGAVASLERLDVGTAHVDLGGGARAGIKARDRIVGDVGGGALLTVAGNPSLEVDTSGGGA